MTKSRYGSDEVNTAPFRNAIVNYLMFINGLKDDTYNFCSINKVLQYQHKVFIKKVMCTPVSITIDAFKQLPMLQPEECAHITLLVMETKMRVQLIHFTKAMSMFM